MMTANFQMGISKQPQSRLLRGTGCTVTLHGHVRAQACILPAVSMNESMRLDFPFSTVKIFSNILPDKHLKTTGDSCALLSTYARDQN